MRLTKLSLLSAKSLQNLGIVLQFLKLLSKKPLKKLNLKRKKVSRKNSNLLKKGLS